jgi:hypothetical protein
MIAGLVFLLLESLFAERLGKSKRASGKQSDPLPETPTGAQDA